MKTRSEKYEDNQPKSAELNSIKMEPDYHALYFQAQDQIKSMREEFHNEMEYQGRRYEERICELEHRYKTDVSKLEEEKELFKEIVKGILHIK